MPQLKLKGSGGAVTAEVTDEQAKKADLGVGELFLAPVGRLDKKKISKYFCKNLGERLSLGCAQSPWGRCPENAAFALPDF